MLVAFISPVKFSKIVFAVWNFVRSLKFYYKNSFCQSLLLKSLEIRLFCHKLNSRKRGNSLSVFHRNVPKYSNNQGGKLVWNWLKFYSERNTGLLAIFSSAKLQTTKQTLTSSRHSLFTYSDFPCHFKVNRDELAVTNRWWMCKKGKRLTITANF